jgi:dihydroxy-acid dehydratase
MSEFHDTAMARIPCICNVAPNGSYLIEDVHRAGGVPAILGELRRGGLLNEDITTVHARTMDEWLLPWDIHSGSTSAEALEIFHAAPGCRRSAEACSQLRGPARWPGDARDALADLPEGPRVGNDLRAGLRRHDHLRRHGCGARRERGRAGVVAVAQSRAASSSG